MELRFDEVYSEMNIEPNNQNTSKVDFCRFMKKFFGIALQL